MDSSDKALQSFKEFTGCSDDSSARRLLSKCAWNLERAIDLFFSGRNWEEAAEGEVMWDEQQPNTSQATTRRRISHFANSPWTTPAVARLAANGNRRTDEIYHDQCPPLAKLDDSVQTLDDSDVQMIEENEGKGTTTLRAVNGSAASDGVRAPIAPVQGVLVDQSFHETYQNRERLWNPVFEQYRQDQQRPSSSASLAFGSRRANGASANNRIDLSEQFAVRPSARAPLAPLSVVPLNRNDDDERPPTHSQHRKTLQNLFRPPVELMFQGDWDQALQAARQKGVWLLVNVQEASEFACAVLNRDIWSAETVREVVRSNFLFWQVYHDSADGARIRGYYGLSSFPSIFIVDPRTGEEVGGRLKASDSVSFLDSLTSFLDQNPTFEARDRFVKEQTSSCAISPHSPNIRTETPTKKRKKPGDSDENATGDETKGQKGKEKTQTEEEEEQMMNRQAKKIKRVMTISECLFDPNEWRHWLLTGDGQSKNKPTTINGKMPPPCIAQMLLRFPDGRTERVRMSTEAPLSALFSLLSSLGFAPAQHQLVLDYPRREYSLTPQSRRLSLESAGFGVQEVVHVDRVAL